MAVKRKVTKARASRIRDRLRSLIRRRTEGIPNAAVSPTKIAPAACQELSDQIEQLRNLVSTRVLDGTQREQRLDMIGQSVLERSRAMESENFNSIKTSDLIYMTELYEEMFFDGLALSLVRQDGLTFRWSSRMTSAGGKTTRIFWPATATKPARKQYEIALSSSLLFQTFHDHERQIRVCGRTCHNRLEAMQRVVEHELIHLVEMLAWTDSNCAAGRFQSIVYRFFGHTEHRHELITQRERAAAHFDIRAGSRVRFEFEGRELVGVVNRITRRATILVEHPNGTRYTDGRSYQKFYIPLPMLRPIQT